MSLISLHDVSISFGSTRLLDKINLHLHGKERIALLGRNGCGKTTLLKIISKIIQPDEGMIAQKKAVTVKYLPQEIPRNLQGFIFDIVSGGLKEDLNLIREYSNISKSLRDTQDKILMKKLDLISREMENKGVWELNTKINTITRKMQLNPRADFKDLSAGEKRRALLAKCLVSSPDILLLDEPTNHMDIFTILKLEEIISEFSGTLIIVTHDRLLVKKIATRIIEIDRGKIFNWEGDYSTFLQKKEEQLKAEAWAEKNFDKKLAKEEIWIRQGIKARRTRNEGRVKALKKMREMRGQRRERNGAVKMGTHQAGLSGKLVIKGRNLNYSYQNKVIINNFSLTVMRGDKVGIIGPNGCGKTTLLQILSGNLKPQAGEITLGTNLKIAYFDQLRDQLDNSKSAKENIVSGAGNEILVINGKQRHVFGYLQDFLFTPERAKTRVEVFSGGERNRLLLAKILANPSNLLVLDEPTNDLDIETLELLEELLLNYQGTILLVSHDRAFLNNLITSTLVFEGKGNIGEYLGEFTHWQIFQPNTQLNLKSPPKEKKTKQPPSAKPKKLTFNEERELKALPRRIEGLEESREKIYGMMSSPDFFKAGGDKISSVKKELSSLEKELEAAYKRWELLES